jgi:hypothetical protein
MNTTSTDTDTDTDTDTIDLLTQLVSSSTLSTNSSTQEYIILEQAHKRNSQYRHQEHLYTSLDKHQDTARFSRYVQNILLPDHILEAINVFSKASLPESAIFSRYIDKYLIKAIKLLE